MQLEKEPILTLVKNHEENVAGEFLSSDLLKDLEEYNYMLSDVSQKEESLNNTVYYLNALFLSLGASSLISSLSAGGFKYLAMTGFVIAILALFNKENILRKWSATKTMHSIWGFVVKPKIFNRDVAFGRLVDKTDRLLSDLGQNKNKALVAKLYQEFNKKDSHKMLRNTFARMMTCYKQEDNHEVLKELMRVLENVKNILKVQNDDFMADDIARELIEHNKQEVIKERNIFKKRENYKL
jgi:hypothetical protein